jgi:VWFA-related protein
MMLTRSILPAFLLAALAVAQDPNTPIFRSGTKAMVAPAVVLGRRGQYINDLKSHDFSLTDNGKLQDIKVDVTYIPISLVVAIQANANAEPVLPAVRTIGPLLQGLVTGDQGEVAIVEFDHRIQTLQDFTTDTGRVKEALAKLRAGSSVSALNDAVVQSVRMLKTRPESRRRVLLLIAEARDYGSEAKVRDALTDLQFANVSVYSVNINQFTNAFRTKASPPPPDRIPPTARTLPGGVAPLPDNVKQLYGNPQNSGEFVPLIADIFRATKSIFVKDPVDVYTRFTGGDERSFVNQKDLESAMSAIGDELHSQYLLTYTPTNRQEGGFHEIVVTVDRPDVKVRTRPGYWVAAQN